MDEDEEQEEEEVDDEEEDVEEEEEEEEGDHSEVTVGRRSGRGLTLKTLLKERVLEPGEGSMTINYLVSAHTVLYLQNKSKEMFVA